eukprot:g1880.t1
MPPLPTTVGRPARKISEHASLRGILTLTAKKEYQRVVSIYRPSGHEPDALPLGYSDSCVIVSEYMIQKT